MKIKNNFINNDNVHMIMVDGKVHNGNYGNIDTKDYKDIDALLKKQKEKSDFTEIAFFQFVGASDYETGEIINIIGIDKNKTSLLGDMVMKDMAVYSTEDVSDMVYLSVPIIKERHRTV